MSKGFYKPSIPENEKFVDKKKKKTGIRIGITYLDSDKYGIKELFKVAKGEKKYLDDLMGFIEKAREINDIGEVIATFVSHNRGTNDDKQSKKKVESLKTDYKIEVDHLIHLHCKIGGNGEFVIHGFQVDNIFEIVWLDPKHDVHS